MMYRMFKVNTNLHACITCLAVMGLFMFAGDAADQRAWVDDQGREVLAVFSGMSDDGESVLLKLEDGSVVPFPLARFSQACQFYVKLAIEAPTLWQAGGVEYNFDSPWPDMVGFREDLEIEVIREDRASGEFVYESLNFRYISDVRLSPSVVRGFALLFEATHEFCKAMPIGMGEGVRTDGKYLIKLYDERASYIKAGAPRSSSGVFMGGRNLIKVPLESLGVRKAGNSYHLDRSVSNRVIAHEVVHQLTPPQYFGNADFNSWFIEGIAEYVAATPYRAGQYNLRGARRAIVEYATGFSKTDNRGRDIGTEINLRSLERFMNLPYSQFVGRNGNFNYAVALLITYYFIHFDGERDAANLKAYKRALLEGKGKEEATMILLNGRSFEELEKDVEREWRRYGVRFKFGN